MIGQVILVILALIGLAAAIWIAGRVARVHREITACQEATERGLRAEAERRRHSHGNGA